MEDDRLLNARNAAAQANAFMQNEQFRKAIETVQATYSAKLFETPVDQPQARETLYRAYRIIPEVLAHLQYVLDNGKLADAELQRLIKMDEAKQQWKNVA